MGGLETQGRLRRVPGYPIIGAAMSDQDWSIRLHGWASAELAHPNSPAGGAGPGFSRLPGPSREVAPWDMPAFDSPASRFHQWPEEMARLEPIPAEDAPMSGKLPLSLGLGSVMRIPVPKTQGLAIELTGRGWKPKGGSTSSLFIQDLTGKRHLRLDLGYNKNSQLVEWHWNQKGTADVFGITNHTSVGPAEQALGVASRYYKSAGRALVVVAVAVDAYSIVTSSSPLRRTTQVVSAWAAAGAGCKVVGAGGATAGTLAAPGIGTAIGGVIGCAVGGFIGYLTAEAAAGYLYDWAEGTIFSTVSPTDPPAGLIGGGGAFGGGGASGSY